jgi:hypothetical protein
MEHKLQGFFKEALYASVENALVLVLCWYLKVLFDINPAVVRLVCYFSSDYTTILKYLVLIWVLTINWQLS